MLVSAALCLLSCSQVVDTGDEDGDNEDSTARRVVIAENGESEYRIVYPVEFNNKEKSATTDVQSVIKSASGAELEIVTDDSSPGKYEILIGNTNRPETAQAKEMIGDDQYIITMISGKLVIYASAEKYYTYVNSYIKYGLADENSVCAYDGMKYVGGAVTSFAADEKVVSNARANITITPYNQSCKVGLFVGKEDGGSLFGYKGYCILVEKGVITFYEMGKNLEEMASKKIEKAKAGEAFDMRLDIYPKKIAAYILDDAEGYEPWPEIELSTDRTSGMSVGFVELSGYGALYTDFSVTEFETGASVQKYTNAVYADYADPDVLAYDGTYYLYGTGGSGGYRVHTSTDLVNWKDKGVCTKNQLWGVTKNYWAPDIEYINGKFYMVVSCNESIGIAVSDSPLGPFTEHSSKLLYTGAIDGHIFVDEDGKIYLYFVYFNNYGIYGVQMNDDLKTVKSNTLKRLINPTEPWEMDKGNVTEGPYMLKHNGLYYLTYSGSNYESAIYAVGYATSDSPLGTFKKYSLNPIMVGNTQIHGTAHHCIVTTLDGSEMFIVYHCHNSVTQVQTRKICIDRIRFSPVEGKDDRLEVYGPSVTAQPYPGN